MDDLRQLQNLRTQRYRPTDEAPTETYLSRFQEKYTRESTVAEEYHEASKLSTYDKHVSEKSAGLFLTDDAIRFAVDRIDPEYGTDSGVELPPPDENPVSRPFCSVVRDRRSVRDFDPEASLSIADLSNLLFYSCGVSATEGEKCLRTYPSAGALYPVEVYLHATGIGGLTDGTYYYRASEHALQYIDGLGPDNSSDAFGDADSFDYETPELVVFLTSAFWRSYAKYGPRAYRYVLQESGHLGQNLHLVATGLGLGAIPRAGYLDSEVNDALSIDGVNEAVVYALVVGSIDGGR